MHFLFEMNLANAVLVVPLALLAALVGFVARKPALSHALWLIVLLKLITPPLFKLPLLPGVVVSSNLSSIGPADDTNRLDSAMPIATVTPYAREASATGISPKTPPELVCEFEINSNSEPMTAASIADVSASDPAKPRPAGWFAVGNVKQLLAVGWAGGTLLLLGVAIVRVVRLVRLLKSCANASPALEREVRSLCDELGVRRPPHVHELPGRFTPFVWAFAGRSVLVVPRELWALLGCDEQSALLLHELAHLRRRDPWVRWLEALATLFYWWHPVLWLARRRLHQAEEQCCDAWVVWARPAWARVYASALVNALEFLAGPPPGRDIAPLGASGLGRLSLITRRITMIMNGGVSRRLSWPSLSVVVLLAAVCLPWLPTQAEPRATSAPQGVGRLEGERAGLSLAKDDPNVVSAGDDLDELADAFELAQSRVRIKEALYNKAKNVQEQARATAARLNRHLGKKEGLVTEEMLNEASENVATTEGNLGVAGAELEEALVQAKQAQRRLERTKQKAKAAENSPGLGAVDPAKPASAATTTDAEKRVLVNLRKIALALHQSANQDGRFPPVAILRPKDGAPLLSWRVAVLPSLGHQDLYNQFHLDESWDSPHNLALLGQMPPEFRTEGRPSTETTTRAIVGKGYIFEPGANQGVAFAEITDGTSNTIMFVSDQLAMPWTRPEAADDAPIGPGKFFAVFGDGSVRTLDGRHKAGIEALLTRAGSEAVNPGDFSVNSADAADANAKERARLEDERARISKIQEERKRAVLEKYTKQKQIADDQSRLQLVKSLTAKEQADRALIMNSLKQIGIALHNYADVNGQLPPAAIRDSDGKPLLSWRVAILPYLDQHELAKQFHMDEPWDSEHNRTLVSKMPAVFGSNPGVTLIRGAGSRSAIFDVSRREGMRFQEVTDGLSNTIAAVVTSQPVVWTQPDEPTTLPLDRIFLALFCDGSVRTLSPRVKPQLDALFTAAGGEVIDFEALAAVDPTIAVDPGSTPVTISAIELRELKRAHAHIAELEAVIDQLKNEIAALREETAK